jgi:hypothetical protein
MDGQFGTIDEKIILGVNWAPMPEKLVSGVNWAPDSCDEEEEDQQESLVPDKLVRGVNWVPDSCDEEEEDQQESQVPEKLVSTCMFASAREACINRNRIHVLNQLASTKVTKFQSDKERADCASLLLPVYLPVLYGQGQHEQHVYDASVTLFWIGRGLV